MRSMGAVGPLVGVGSLMITRVRCCGTYPNIEHMTRSGVLLGLHYRMQLPT